MINGLADVISRIQEIQSLFPTGQATASSGSANFSVALASAMNSSGSTGASVVADASNYLGVPYTLGGTNPTTGFDCSGLVQKVFADLGQKLPRLASDQAQAGTPVASLADAQPGDLVAFGNPVHHIGIYVGGGKMIDAPHTGTSVRIEQITETPTAIRRIMAGPSESMAPGFAWLAAGLGLPVASTGMSGVATSSASAGGFGSLFDAATARYSLPSGLLSAVARAESGYNPKALSPSGALGLMQLMPATAQGLGVSPLNPAQAIDGAARILSGNLNRFGSVPLALAAYNAGDSAVTRYGGIPPYPETKAYVATVMRYLNGVNP